MLNVTKKIMPLAVLLVSSASAHAYDVGRVELHGFASIGYVQSSENNIIEDSEDGTFQFNEFGLNAGTTFFDDIYIGVQVMSRDYGAVGNNDIYVNWALVDYQWRDILGFKLGKVKLPLGLYGDIRDYDFLRTPIFLPQSIYNDNYRELNDSYTGGGIYGTFDLGQGGRLKYDLFYGLEQDIDKDGGIARDVNLGGMQFIESTVDYTFGGRLKWHTPVSGLQLAVSFRQLDTTTDAKSTDTPLFMNIILDDVQSTTFSGEYSIGRFTIMGEYEMVRGDIVRTIDMTSLGQPLITSKSEINAEHYYAQVSYRFTDWFTAGVYYSVDVPNTDDRDGESLIERGLQDISAWQNDLAVTTRFDVTDFWLIKLEYHYVDGTSLLTEADNPDGFEKSWDYFAIKTTLSF